MFCQFDYLPTPEVVAMCLKSAVAAGPGAKSVKVLHLEALHKVKGEVSPFMSIIILVAQPSPFGEGPVTL